MTAACNTLEAPAVSKTHGMRSQIRTIRTGFSKPTLAAMTSTAAPCRAISAPDKTTIGSMVLLAGSTKVEPVTTYVTIMGINGMRRLRFKKVSTLF